VCGKDVDAAYEEELGELDVVIREPHQWSANVAQGLLIVDTDPSRPTLEQLWESQVVLELHGPKGRHVTCTISLLDKHGVPLVKKTLPPLSLPVASAAWADHFGRRFRDLHEVEDAYDTAHVCELQFKADELGAFQLKCEREFTPLRWALRRSGDAQTVTLVDDSGSEERLEVGRLAFETPEKQDRIGQELAEQPLTVPATGGMYFARRGDVTAAIIIPPGGRGLADLRCEPHVSDRARSPEQVLGMLRLIDLWTQARVTGSVFSLSRRRKVVLELTRHLFYILCGTAWERAEGSWMRHGGGGFGTLQRAVSDSRIAETITRECSRLAALPSTDRVRTLASLVRKPANLVPRAHVVMRKPGSAIIQRKPDLTRDDTEWLCELALRLASDPSGVTAWAKPNLTAGVKRLFELPIIALAARFLVLAIDHHAQRPSLADGLYGGWAWK
jgi:hypothetical protein